MSAYPLVRASLRPGMRVKLEAHDAVFTVTTCGRTACVLCERGAVPVRATGMESRTVHVAVDNLCADGAP